MSFEDYSKLLEHYILDANKHPSTFIDMIYYCTNNNTRLQEKEINLIHEIEKIYDLERIPLIIVHTQATSESFHSQFKNFVEKKYEGKFSVIKLLARDLDDKRANVLEDLKNETERKKNNI